LEKQIDLGVLIDSTETFWEYVNLVDSYLNENNTPFVRQVFYHTCLTNGVQFIPALFVLAHFAKSPFGLVQGLVLPVCESA